MYVRILQENSEQTSFNWFVDSLMEQKHNSNTSVCLNMRAFVCMLDPVSAL